jgi:hypothetical protein
MFCPLQIPSELTTMFTKTQELISKALAIRDNSLAAIDPPLPLDRLTDPLPSNVLAIPGKLLTKEELEITSHDPEALLDAIRSRKYSCVTVTKAFLRRAAAAQTLVGCHDTPILSPS